MKNDEETNTNPERKRLRSKWLDPNADRARRSNKNERRLASRLGGKRVARSGGKALSRWDTTAVPGLAGNPTEGGDVKTPDFYLENKRTDRKSVPVKKDWLDKVRVAAKRVGKDPGLILTFEDGRKPPEDWVAIPLDVFERLRRKAGD